MRPPSVLISSPQLRAQMMQAVFFQSSFVVTSMMLRSDQWLAK
jgi:uncharacterized lipoprotein YajG